MKTLIQVAVICILTTTAYGQNNKTINIPHHKNRDSTLWYKWQHEREDKLKLTNLISCTENFHFRFWTTGQAVDIWTNDYKSFFGRLTNYSYSYEPFDYDKQKRKPSRTFSNQVQLDTSLARQSYCLINAISSIPDQDSITGWGQGFDGITYFFETSTPVYYSFKRYWTPTAQDSNLIEAKQIQKFVDSIYTILNLSIEFDKFFTTLKPGLYTNDNFMISRKLTEKQIETWKKYKPNRDYMASVKDTLNNYLSDTLTKIFQKYGELECYNHFYLKFSKKNTLIKITTNSHFLNFKDRMDSYKCRRKIRKAFKDVQFDFVHSKVSYWKAIYYEDKKVRIID